MSDSLIIKGSLKALHIPEFMKRTYVTLDNDEKIDIPVTKEGIICPIGMSTNEETFLVKDYPNRLESKSLAEEIKEAITFFTFLSHDLSNNSLRGKFRTNSGLVFDVSIKIPEDYPNSSPKAITYFRQLEDCTFYHNLKQKKASYSFETWKYSNLIDFIGSTILWLNKKECHALFNIWLGSKVTRTSTETL